MQLIDLSHAVEDGLITYKGLPAPIICDYLSREESRQHYAEGTEFHIGKIEMVANTGTYIDAPFHRFADGADLAAISLEQMAHLEGILVSVKPGPDRAINANYFQGLDVTGKAVLIHTGWARYWQSVQYFEGHPYLATEAAEYLRDRGATLVGIDSLNIDNTATGERPVHTSLLQANILIVEHLCNLENLPAQRPFRFYAVPVKVKAFGTFPVRAFANVE